MTQDTAAAETNAVSTDVFTAATSRCTRRAWDLFLKFRHDPARFETAAVRARITARTRPELMDIQRVLKEEGGLTRMTAFEDERLNECFVELTAPLATIQRVILHPGLTQFDAIRAD